MANADAMLAGKPARTSPGDTRDYKRKSKTSEQRRGRVGWLFIAPFGIVFLVFLVAPLAYAFYLSLFSKGLATGTIFTGFANYGKAFTDPSFLKGVSFVIRFALVLIPVQMVISLAIALILDAISQVDGSTLTTVAALNLPAQT